MVFAGETPELWGESGEAFMASLVESIPESKDLSTIPVVAEFPDVFPDELPGLLPKRNVEFEIELVSDTTPISKAPYRLAPTELKELKTQLVELLWARFIRPSTSPW